MTALSIARLIRVAVSISATPAQAQNLSTLLLLVDDPQIDVTERLREYGSLPEVAAQFGSNGPVYDAAELWFGQEPQPESLLIGRWAKIDTKGQLICGTLQTSNQSIASWTGIADGAFAINVDGVSAPVNVTGCNFTAQTTLNGVATVINARLAAAGVGALVVYDANFERFIFTSDTTGPTSSVSFLTSPSSGTDIHSKLSGTAALGAYVANGIDAETALAAVTMFDDRFGQKWYAVQVLGASDDDVFGIAGFVQASTNKHVQGATSQDANALSSVSTSDIGYRLKAAGYSKTLVQYSSQNAYASVSALARILITDWTGSNTAIDLMYKNEPGVVAEQLNTTQVNALEAKGYNVFVAYNNDTQILEPGNMATGDPADLIIGADAYAIDLQVAAYNVLKTISTKVAQTDSGNHLLKTAMDQVSAQYVRNGFLAPGVWNSAGFGQIEQGDLLPKGWYIFAPPVANQSQAARAARKSVPFQIAAKSAGSIREADIAVEINP